MSEYTVVKTGVPIGKIVKFMRWSKEKWPVVSYAKYGVFPEQYISMVFPAYLGKEVMLRMLNGELTPEKISERFKKA